MPDHHHTVLAHREEVIGLTRSPVLKLLDQTHKDINTTARAPQQVSTWGRKHHINTSLARVHGTFPHRNDEGSWIRTHCLTLLAWLHFRINTTEHTLCIYISQHTYTCSYCTVLVLHLITLVFSMQNGEYGEYANVLKTLQILKWALL